MTDETSTLAFFPVHRWRDACADTFGAELVRIVDETRSLDERVIRLAECQRAIKARLAATGLPESLRRDALANWTRRVFAAEQAALGERKAR